MKSYVYPACTEVMEPFKTLRPSSVRQNSGRMNINSSAAMLSAKCCRLLYAILFYIKLYETCKFNGKCMIGRG